MPPRAYRLVGRGDGLHFYSGYVVAQHLREFYSNDFTVEIQDLTPTAWLFYTEEKTRTGVWTKPTAFETAVVEVLEDGTFLDVPSWIESVRKLVQAHLPEPDEEGRILRWMNQLKSTTHTFVWLRFRQGDDILQPDVVVELDTDKCPKTSSNFRHLCRGDHPSDDKLTYKNSTVFRVIPGALIQGGDITEDGAGQGRAQPKSWFGGEFADESYEIIHGTEGVVGMVNRSRPHSNASQFYITSAPCSYLDKRSVAFGHVILGLEVIREIASSSLKPNQSPVEPIVIEDCGELELA